MFSLQMWSSLFMLLLVCSVLTIAAQTHPSFRVIPDQYHPSQYTNTSNPKVRLYQTTDVHPSVLYINDICAMIFTLELIIKFIVWPNKASFFTSFFNIIDLLSVVPMAICCLLTWFDPYFWLKRNIVLAYCITAFSSVCRAIRIFKLVKHNNGLKTMWLALRASTQEICLLVLLMAIGMLIFATLIYYAEFALIDDTFSSIPVGFWWSIITMTTVGYGDTYPHSSAGYVVGALCAVVGMLITGLPIPIIANNFYLYYASAKLPTKISDGDTDFTLITPPETNPNQVETLKRKSGTLSNSLPATNT